VLREKDERGPVVAEVVENMQRKQKFEFDLGLQHEAVKSRVLSSNSS
jgi:hypothetical protein